MRARIDKKEKAVCTHNLNETVKELNYESIYKGQTTIAQQFIVGKYHPSLPHQSRTAWRAVCDKGRLKITA
jgi:hypothetical protein